MVSFCFNNSLFQILFVKITSRLLLPNWILGDTLSFLFSLVLLFLFLCSALISHCSQTLFSGCASGELSLFVVQLLSQVRRFGTPWSQMNIPMNVQDWFPLGMTDLLSLQSKGLSRVFSSTTVQKHQFFGAQPSLWSNSYICIWLLEKLYI